MIAVLLFILGVFPGAFVPSLRGSAFADEALTNRLHALIVETSRSELGACNEAGFGRARCQQFHRDLADSANLRSVAPEFVAKDDADGRIAHFLSGCDLTHGHHPFGEETELGVALTPGGPFRFYDGRFGGGDASDAIVRAGGYKVPGDPDAAPFSWASYYFVAARAPCRRKTYALLRYGDLERPARLPHDDGIVLWQGKPYVLAVWQLAEGADPAFVVSLYQLEKPELEERSLAVEVFLFLKPATPK